MMVAMRKPCCLTALAVALALTLVRQVSTQPPEMNVVNVRYGKSFSAFLPSEMTPLSQTSLPRSLTQDTFPKRVILWLLVERDGLIWRTHSPTRTTRLVAIRRVQATLSVVVW